MITTSDPCYAKHLQKALQSIDRSGDCWIWTGPRDRHGYGIIECWHNFKRDGKRARAKAHRFLWEALNGSIPEGLELCHHCDTKPCVRGDHLYPGTHTDNMRDMSVRKRRTWTGNRGSFQAGAKHRGAKLTPEQVQEIRERYALGGIRQTDLAREFGVGQMTISWIVRGVTWAAA